MHLSLPLTNRVAVFALAMGIFLVAPLIMRLAAGSARELVAELGGRGPADRDMTDSYRPGDRG